MKFLEERDVKKLKRQFTVFLVLATILEFTNIGSVFLRHVGFEELAQKVEVQKAHAADTRIFITATSTTSWSVPADWNSSNTIEVIGGGGGGGTSNNLGDGGGGGGAYAKISNYNVGASTTILVQVGVGGGQNVSGTLSFWGGGGAVTTCTGKAVCADFGGTGRADVKGTGGTTANSSGTTKYAGGDGGTGHTTGDTGGGGGGAGGPLGAGAAGGDGGASTGSGGGGGGGAGGSGAGGIGQSASSSAGNGGKGGNGPGGSGGGAGGNATHGTAATAASGGGGGAGDNDFNGAAGAMYTEWDSTHGSGGGGGGSADAHTGVANQTSMGANYGGGGGGADGAGAWGKGGDGIIVITYTPSPAPNVSSFTNNTDGTLTDGSRSSQSSTLTGVNFGTVSAGSRATCGGGAGTGCIHFEVNGSTTVADASISSWSDTSITFIVSSTLATLGGTSSLKVYAASLGDSTPNDFYIYPTISSMAVCANCNANAAREYSSSDTDGLIMLSGDHFGSSTGNILFAGNFSNISATIHATKATFSTAGSSTWQVPEGVTSITVKAWGAGGGSGGTGSGGAASTGAGGGGGFAQATLTVSPEETLIVYIGGGGIGGGGTTATNGAGGGGYSAVVRSSTYLITAGGGAGGGGANAGQTGGAGGAGGDSSGVTGSNSSVGAVAGTGGTQSAGGTGGSGGGNGTDGQSGSSNQGGTGGAGGGSAGGVNGGGAGGGEYNGAGGGGGGYYGGGGGENSKTGGGGSGAGGGGGSSFVGCVTCTATTTTAGSGTSTGNMIDTDYTGTVGVGGTGITAADLSGNTGNNGYMVISYSAGSCTASGWSAVQHFGNTVCVQVPASISNSVYTGTVQLQASSSAKTDSISFRVLPRITSNTPASTSTGNVVQISGDHFCQSGTCPGSSQSYVRGNFYDSDATVRTSATSSFSSNTAGNLLVVSIGYATTTCSAVTSSIPTDSAGNTYYLAVQSCNASQNYPIYTYYAYNINASAATNTVTFTLSKGAAYIRLHLQEYTDPNGSFTSDPLDVVASSTGNSSSLSSGSATITSANDIIYGFGGQNPGPITSMGSGFTLRQPAAGGYSTASEDKLATSTGSQSATMTASGAGQWVMQMAAFKPASGGFISASNNIKFGSTTSTATDFVSQTGGAGACNGTSAAWQHTEICVKVPTSTPAGSASTTVRSNTLYVSNAKAFNVSSTGSTIPDGPAGLAQWTKDGGTQLSVGSSTASTTLVFKANLSASTSINMALQIEATSTGNSFACGAGACGNAYQSATYSSVSSVTGASTTISGLSAAGETGTGYHWQARARNTTTDEYSAWTSFGGNGEGAADFILDITAPTITSLASSSITSSSAAVTWNTSGEAATSRVQYSSSTGSSGSSTFATAGSSTWQVPNGVTSITVKAWGGGGGGSDAVGGGGGFTQSTITVTPNESLIVYVGGGGNGSGNAGGGGGYSAVTRGEILTDHSNVLIQAGGGGGGARGNSVGAGGAGGGSSGVTGSTDIAGGGGGGGGTSSAGGAGGTGGGSGTDGSPGTANAGGIGGDGGGGSGGTNGGAAGSSNGKGGGGGGGGYFGGGGGEDGSAGGFHGGGGGGGSGFVECATCTATTTTAGSGTSTGNNTDVDYTGSVGVGGALSGSGNNGYVVISYTGGFSGFAASCDTNNDCTALADLAPPGTNSHNVALTSLASNTTYYFRARSQDASGNESMSATSTFYTTSTSGLPATGNITSAVFDTGSSSTGAAYNSILWKGTAGTGKVRFQLASSNSSSGPWTYYGSTDGGATCDSNNWYSTTAPGAPAEISCAPKQHHNHRFFRYKIQLCSSTDCSSIGATSPSVTGVVVNWSP